MKYLFLLVPFFSFAQTWPSEDCPDRPYTKAGSDIIYHTCDCGVQVPNKLLKVMDFLRIKIPNKCADNYCPVCSNIELKEHIKSMKREVGMELWNFYEKESYKQGCPIEPNYMDSHGTDKSISGHAYAYKNRDEDSSFIPVHDIVMGGSGTTISSSAAWTTLTVDTIESDHKYINGKLVKSTTRKSSSPTMILGSDWDSTFTVKKKP